MIASPHGLIAGIVGVAGGFVIFLLFGLIFTLYSSHRAHTEEVEARAAVLGQWRETKDVMIKGAPKSTPRVREEKQVVPVVRPGFVAQALQNQGTSAVTGSEGRPAVRGGSEEIRRPSLARTQSGWGRSDRSMRGSVSDVPKRSERAGERGRFSGRDRDRVRENVRERDQDRELDRRDEGRNRRQRR